MLKLSLFIYNLTRAVFHFGRLVNDTEPNCEIIWGFIKVKKTLYI